MGRANTSSIDTKNGDKIAAFGTQQRASIKASFSPDEQKKQIINARKEDNLYAKKVKAKKKAKLAKLSRKKNKK